MKVSDIKRDPVCEMDVRESDYKTIYMERQYIFCSQQCLDRFEKNPGLYVGRPGKPSPKQKGKALIKSRTIKLDTVIPDEIKVKIIQAITGMMGIKNIQITRNLIRITYDLLEVTAEQIENTITTTSINLSDDWVSRLKSAFVHYAEETELINMESEHDHHCHH